MCVDHELFTNRFPVTHYGRCAVLFTKDTIHPDVEVKSIHLHDTRRELLYKVMEGDPGSVLQGRAITCLFSSTTSQRPENIHSSVPTY